MIAENNMAGALAGMLIAGVLLASCGGKSSSERIDAGPGPTVSLALQKRPKLLTKEEQDSQWREHLAKYGSQVFSQIKIWEVEDLRPGSHFVRLHTCATEIATGISRYYTFGFNFGFHHDLYEGAPLQEVLYGLHAWPYSDQLLGPVYNMSPQEQADDDESRKASEQYVLRNPPKDRHYVKDPCNGQE